MSEPGVGFREWLGRSGGGDDQLDRLNEQIVERLRATTTTVPTSTMVDGHDAIRPCFINPRRTGAEVDELVDNTRRVGASLAETGPTR